MNKIQKEIFSMQEHKLQPNRHAKIPNKFHKKTNTLSMCIQDITIIMIMFVIHRETNVKHFSFCKGLF